MTLTVLVTGFEPFDKEPINPAWEAARALDGWGEADFRVVAHQLPCVFHRAIDSLLEAMLAHEPALVICLGQAGGRNDISIERVAINVDDARIPDNAQQQPIDAPIVPGGPAAYFSTLPIKAIAAAVRAEGLPASVSQTAGTFVCNHIFYALMHALALHGNRARGGFIHIPYLPQQAAQHANAPSMALADTIRGLQIAIRTALATGTDLREGGGATH